MRAQGREVPAAFYERPEIEGHLQLYWSAFLDLTTERQVGMGLGPIPFSKIKAYATDDLDLDGEESERFRLIIRRMDDAYLSLSSTKPDQRTARQVPADDVTGVRQVFRNIAAKQDRDKRDRAKPGKP